MRIGSEQKDTLGSSPVSGTTYDEAVQSVIDREYGRVRNGAKILARHAKASLPAAKHWIYGRRVPSGEHLLNLLAECESLAEEINRLVAERKQTRG